MAKPAPIDMSNFSMPATHEVICKTCKFYDKRHEDVMGKSAQCYRYPPSLMDSEGNIFCTPVKEDHWCGEWKFF